MKKNIDELVKKIIKESLEGKAGELEDKISMEEWDQEPTISNQPSDMHEDTCGYHMKTFGEDDERTKRFCKSSEIGEKLIGGQKNLDKNKNGRLDKKDFEMLRGDVEEGFDDDGERDTAFSRMRSGKGDVKDIDWEDITDDSETAFSRMKSGKGDVEDIDFEDMPRKKSNSFFDKMKKKLGLGEDEEVEEGNAFTGALAKTKKGDKFNLGGKSYTDRSNLEEAEKFIKKAIKTVNFNKNTVKESLQLTESEMIDLIEKIVMEQKKAKGMAETEKVLSANKKENEAAISAVTKKMKEYLKDGSKGEYSMEPKIFPKGNGELAKMDKMAYIPDGPTQEYIDNFVAAALENNTYDEMHPNEEWVTDNIEGSSRTGNNPEWANAVDNGVNKKRNKIRKDNLLGAVKAMAYNKAPQPVTDDSKSGPTGKFYKNFGKDAGKKATKILNQLESTDKKTEKLISEEFDKMKHLIGYNKKTQ
jgi:hypothetical protein